MKSYLSLIPISAKIRRRQNRMTILCIILSVFLVTVIFSVVDVMFRKEAREMLEKHGSWHIQIQDIDRETGEAVSSREDVKAAGWLESFNTDGDQPYYVEEKRAVLYGTDRTYLEELANGMEEGTFTGQNGEVVLSANAKLAFQAQLGDRITLQTPGGEREFRISGFGTDDKEYYEDQTFLIAVYMTQDAFDEIMAENNQEGEARWYFQFQNAKAASGAVSEIEEQYQVPEEKLSENTAVMGLSGQSSSEAVKNIYGIAMVLFVLVLLAGVLMISGSLNSSVAQRTKFFGMLRCIGASSGQIVRLVRLEALQWCKTAVPAGLILGTLASWTVCALLRFKVGGEFADIQVIVLSPAGLLSGAGVGIITVLLAAQAPARRASKVSPMAAASGSEDTLPAVRHIIKRRLGSVEWNLGIHHGTASRKNWLLMTASFSLSIILFLCFSVGINFARELLPSFRSWQPDVSLNGYANALVLDKKLTDNIRSIPGVEQVFCTAYLEQVPAESSRQGIEYVNLVSYSNALLDSSKECLVQGDLEEIYGNSSQVMTVENKDNPLKTGDKLKISGEEVEIACGVSDSVWPGEYSVICSQETFERLTGETNYSLISIQLGETATEETVRQISSLGDSDVIFTDLRTRNQEDANTYLAARLVMYSFLGILAMITLFGMVNSISMSVSARIRQYGAMRAVGMDGRQLGVMVAAEALTYVLSGVFVGSVLGILLSRFLHLQLLTRYFGKPWSLPVPLLAVILIFALLTAAAAVYAPVKRIQRMPVTETINEL